MLTGNRRVPSNSTCLPPLAIALLAAVLAPGCGYVGAAAAAIIATQPDTGSEPPPQVAPLVILKPILRQDGLISIDYTLQDANGDAVDIQVDYSTDSGSNWAVGASEGPGGDGTTGLASSETGEDHTFEWDSIPDIGTSAFTQAQIRITATDAKGKVGQPAVSGDFVVGNDAPSVTFPSPVPTSVNLVAITYDLTDTTQDACSLLVEWSTDNGATFDANPATITVGSISNLASDPAGVTHTVAWDSVQDVGLNNFPEVVLRLTPSDVFDTGASEVTNAFVLENNDNPTAFIEQVDRQKGVVRVNFHLVDPQSDPMSVAFSFSTDSGASYAPMTLTPMSVTTGLPPTTGTPHSVDWDSFSDIGNLADTVRIQVIPSDQAGTGNPFETGDFVVGNDPPSILVTSMLNEIHKEGIISLEFTITDSTNDPVDLAVDYTTDGGATFSPATIEVGSIVDVTPGPLPQKIAWAAIVDLPNQDAPFVNVRIEPCDDETVIPECGPAGNTQAFRVINVDRPFGVIASPSVGDAVEGNVGISYLLFESASQPVDITMEFSTDSGGTYTVATERPGPPSEGTTGLSTIPEGDRHDFVWDSGADLPGIDLTTVQLLVTPDDGQPGIARVMDGPFLINNNREPEAFVGTPSSPQIQGNVAVNYSIGDFESDPVWITVEFSTDGGVTFSPATDAGPGAGSDGTIALSSSALALPHVFVWNSIVDAVALNLKEDDVIFRVTPTDNVPVPLLGRGPTSQTILFSVDNTDPPTVAIGPVANQTGNVVVNYTLFDDESAPVDIAVEYSTDGGGTYRVAKECTGCSAPASEGLTALGSSPGGIAHTFVWESDFDLGPALVTGITLRITPSDTKVGMAGISNTFAVDNNDAPIALIRTPQGIPSGDIVISYALSDTHGDTASVTARFSTDGGSTFATATEKPGLPSEGTSGLITSPAGVNHVFVWNSSALTDIGLAFAPSVIFRITPQDSSTGLPADTGTFPVNNQNLLPVVRIDPVARSLTDNVTITYLISDGDLDLADVVVEWRQGGAFTAATDAGPGAGSDGTTGLSTTATGTPHTFVWDSAADLPVGAQPGLEIRISPSDGDGTGFPDTSNVFIRGNDAPTVAITSPLGGTQSGLIEFIFTLADSTSDAVDVSAEYSTDTGSTWKTATISVGGLASLFAPPAGVSHDIAWNSLGDLGVANLTGVIFRITPTDSLLASGLPSTVTIDISNNDVPISFIGSPAVDDVKSGDIQVSHVLIDGNSDTITVTVEFSTDGGASWGLATLANTDEGTISGNRISGLSSTPDGLGHSFDWVSGTDVVSTDIAQARLRITPDDPLNTGTPFTTANFLVNNNIEPRAAVSTPSSPQVGNVTVTYNLFDQEGDFTDIDLVFSTDGGQTFAGAMEVPGPPSEGLVNLAASPAGATHTFVWSTTANGVAIAAAENDVIIRVVPRDNPNLLLGLGASGQTDIFTVDNTTAPSVAIANPSSPQTGNMVVDYTLTDAESALQSIVVEYSINGIDYFIAKECVSCTLPASDGLTNLTSSPGGTAHVFRWDTAADLGPAFVTGVRLRITPTDTKTGSPDVTPTFDVDNNEAPVAFVTTPAGAPSGDVVISYTLTDTNGDGASVTAWYSTDSGTSFQAATERPGLPSEGLSNLVTSTAGINHVFVWDSITDVGFGFFPNVVFGVIPSDTTPGVQANSNVFAISNQTLLPGVAIDFVPRSFLDNVTIDYRLFDGDSDPADITVEWRRNAGFWNPATDAGAGAGSDGTTGLSTTPSGAAHTFVWDSATDLGSPGAAVAGLEIQITPQDADGTGTPDISNIFIRGNDTPILTITSPLGGTQSGLIEFTYDLEDSTSDPVDLAADFSTDSGLSWTTATISVGETIDVTSAPTPGLPHDLAWNSVADLGIANLTGVRFRLVPSDTGTGTGSTATFDVDNNDLPIAFIGSPAAADLRSGDVTIEYILIDGNGEAIDITPLYSTDGSTYLAATEKAGPPSEGVTGLTSSPDGIGHVFVWDSLTDLGAVDSATVTFRIIPDDPQNTGVAFTTPDFFVNNNGEPLATVSTPASPQVGNVTVNYNLFDLESDPVDIALRFSTDGGQTFADATEVVGPPSEGLSGLAASPGGDAHVFVWSTTLDGVAIAAAENDVIIRVVPRDNPDLTLGLGTTGQTDIFTVDNTVAPTVTIVDPVSPQTGDIVIDYTLFDTESDLQDIVVEYSTDGTNFFLAKECVSCTLPASDGLTGLASSPGGTAHVFRWETATDLGPAFVSGVQVRITPTDTKTGAPDVTLAFDVDNNDAPVAFVTTPSGTPSGDVVVSYTLTDTNSDTASITAWYSTDSGTSFQVATEQPGLPSEGLSNLITSTSGINHVFVWDSITDLGFGFFPTVVFGVIPSDTTGGVQADSGVFAVSNQTLLPGVAIDFVPRSFLDDVTITYRLFDGDSDPADITVEWRQNAGAWSAATDAGGASEGKTGLTTSPSGVSHTFVWDSATDLGSPGAAMTGLEIRITPQDTDGTGTPDITNVFIRGNDIPILTITSPLGGTQSGLIEIIYDLEDSTSDPVDIAADYSTDGGLSWNVATISVGETTDVTSAPSPGIPHDLAWNSVADLLVQDFAGVRFRLTPTDTDPGTGDFVTFDVNNNDEPISFIGAPAISDLESGDVGVSHILIDGNSDTIGVTVLFSTDGGGIFNDATVSNPDEGAVVPPNQITGLSSSPDGVEHSFTWQSGSDFAGLDTDQAQLRITPDDSKNPGVSFTTANFLVNNNAEPTATVQTPSGSQELDIDINYVLFDAESNDCDIDVLYSIDGTNFFAATESTDVLSEGLTALPASPGGTAHLFIWDTSQATGDDIGRLAAESAVLIRVVPRDNPNLTLGLGTRGQSDFFTVDNTSPPVVSIAVVPDPSSGDITIDYTLTDLESDLQSIVVEYDAGSGYLPATEGVGSDGTSGLSASPAGTPHVFVWESQTDLGRAYVAGVTIRITASDTKIGAPDVSNAFVVDNNDAPVATVATPQGTARGDIVISYKLSDTNSDLASITAWYSTDSGGTFSAATEQPGLPSEGTSGLITSTTGINHIFVWDSVTDIGFGSFPTVVFGVIPSDAHATGIQADSGIFPVSNQLLLPAAVIAPVARSFTDNVTIDYRLFDGDSDSSDIVVEWRQGAGAWGLATDAGSGAGSDGTTGLSASPAGDAHVFVWDSAADLPAGAQENLQIRITPTDNDGTGTPGISNPFIRGNDIPAVAITDPLGSPPALGGLVRFAFDLTDSTSDPIDVISDFSTDNGLSWQPAAIAVGATTDLASSPTGISHSFAWNSLGDLGPQNIGSVRFRITPRDFPPPDGTSDFVTIDVENNDLPIVFIGSPAELDLRSGDVDIEYILIDADSDPITIQPFYSTDGTTYVAATERTGAPSEGTGPLTSSPDGIPHLFVWDSVANLGANDYDTVTFRIIPDDPADTGVAFTTPDFLVNNNQEPVVKAIDPFASPGDQSDNVAIDYTLTDAESDNTDLTVTYSTDGGGTWFTATDAGPSAGSDGTTALANSPGGTAHAFVWDSAADLSGIRETSVVVRFEPRDNANLTLGLGTPGQTAVFVIDNTVAPEVNNLVNAGNTGAITLDYDLFDTEPAASVDLEVTYSTNSGSTYEPALVANPQPEGSASGNMILGQIPSSTPPGAPKSFDWDSDADIGRTNVTGVILRVIPMDTKIGAPTEVTFDVLNNDAPEVLLTDVTGVQSGDVNISYKLRDTFSDPCTIVVEYSTDGGSTFQAATEQPGFPSEGTGVPPLTSGPPLQEVGHLFIWDTVTDVSSTLQTDVVFQITPDDGTVSGAPVATSVFIVDNSIPANLVLGQSNFFQGGVDGRGFDSGTGNRGGLAWDGSQLFVCDPGNHRVLILNGVPTSDFQTADIVVGQKDFTVNEQNFGGLSASSLNNPMGVHSDGTSLYVCDTDNHRVLIWDTIPINNNEPADWVLGQTAFNVNQADQGGAAGQGTLDLPEAAWVVPGTPDRLFVSDTNNHRIMIWNLPITSNGQLADNVLGQATFAGQSANPGGRTASTLNVPRGLYADGSTTLFCADSLNHRVLQWDLPITVNAQAADRVLGQPDMNSGNADFDASDPSCLELNIAGQTRRTFNQPWGVYGDGANTYVADMNNHRVLIWTSTAPPGPPSGPWTCADYVLGQTQGFQSFANEPLGVPSDTNLRFPIAVASTGSELVICDRGNERLKIHLTIPAADNAAADAVFGQEDFFSNMANHAAVNARSLRVAAGTDTDGSILFAADWDNSRILGWSTMPDVNNKNPDIVLGQPDFTSFSRVTSASGVSRPTDVAYDPGGNRLFVADRENNRVLIYDGPFSIGMDASIWIGQNSPSTPFPGFGQNQLRSPAGVSWDGSDLWVADELNHRVLRYTPPLAINMNASIRLGQDAYGKNPPDHGDNDGTRGMRNPVALVSTGTELLVCDRGNHRVMVWTSIGSIADDAQAAFVLGQADFTIPGTAGLTRSRFTYPGGVESDGTTVIVSDGGNHRILIWDTFPSAHDTPADRIIGQPGYTIGIPNKGGVTELSLFLGNRQCMSPALIGMTLWAPDQSNNRLLRYDVTP